MGRTDLDGGAGGSGGSGGARVPFILHVYTDGIPVPRKRQHTACRQRDHRRQWNPIWCSTATQVAVRLRTHTLIRVRTDTEAQCADQGVL